VFHCLPSDLEGQDGLLLMEMLEMKYWSEIAHQFKEDPAKVEGEDRIRIQFACEGDDKALTRPGDEFTVELMAELRQKQE